jgi:hypothetical protein
MRSKLLVVSIATAVLGIAACGSSKKSSSTTAPGAPPATTTPAKGKTAQKGALPSRTYSVKMTGKAETPAGPPNASASAVVTLHGNTNQACWRFSKIHGVVGATYAHIHVGAKGTAGPVVVPLSTGLKFMTKGCVSVSATRIKAIERNPHGYYVNIHSKKYPIGAVRSQL